MYGFGKYPQYSLSGCIIVTIIGCLNTQKVEHEQAESLFAPQLQCSSILHTTRSGILFSMSSKTSTNSLLAPAKGQCCPQKFKTVIYMAKLYTLEMQQWSNFADNEVVGGSNSNSKHEACIVKYNWSITEDKYVFLMSIFFSIVNTKLFVLSIIYIALIGNI